MNAQTIRKYIKFIGVLVLLLVVSLLAPASVPDIADAQYGDQPVTSVQFCHNPPGNPGKYNNLNTSVNAFFNAGHPNHAGDIVPPFYYLSKSQTEYFEGMNWTAQNQLIWENNCEAPPVTPRTSVVPGVSVEQATCENNNLPKVLVVPTDGCTYVIDPAPAAGSTVTVTASIALATHQWGLCGAEWFLSDNTAITVIELEPAEDCRAFVVPANLTVKQATCDAAPLLTLPSDGNGVTYSQDVEAAPGVTVTVTATLNTETHLWGEIPAPWSLDAETGVVSQVIDFTIPDCPGPDVTPTPVDPTPTDPTPTPTDPPVQPTPTDPTPTDPTPVPTDPPVEPTPTDPTPTPVDPTPTDPVVPPQEQTTTTSKAEEAGALPEAGTGTGRGISSNTALLLAATVLAAGGLIVIGVRKGARS